MKFLYVFAAMLVCVCAQEWYGGDEPSAYVDNSEYQYRLDQLRKQRARRPRREVTGSLPVGDNGQLIGTLGNTAKGGLYGTGAYEHTLVNNDGGRLAAQAYGTRVLNPNRDSTYYGGKLSWQDSNAQASLDASRRIGGRARGTGAYEHTLVNNDGGRLAAQAYGTRVLNPNRDSTYYGGKLSWQDSNAQASLDASRRIGGRARMDLEAGGRWEPFKNADVTAGAYFSHREGRPSDYGGRAKFNYRF